MPRLVIHSQEHAGTVIGGEVTGSSFGPEKVHDMFRNIERFGVPAPDLSFPSFSVLQEVRCFFRIKSSE